MVRIQDIPTFCINLDGAESRWKQIQQQAHAYDISITRWPASTPSDASSLQFGQNLSGGQQACALSHFRIWSHAIEHNLDAVFVLEDDALFRKDWIHILNSKLSTLYEEDPQWDSLFLNCSEEIHPQNTWTIIKRQAMTAGYILNKHAIQFLYEKYKGSLVCADWMTQILQERGHSYSLFPWLVIQDGSPSFIQSDNSPDYQKVLRLLNSANYSLSNYTIPEKRISWKDYFSQLAKLVSKRSPCSRLHVGCVLVRENHIISTGYNGFLPGASHTSIIVDNHEQATVHAEQNCIADCAKRGIPTIGSHAYITHYPCPSCYKTLVAAGVSKIFYLDDYRNSQIVEDLVKETSIPVIHLETAKEF
jgi:dCMP deaminase